MFERLNGPARRVLLLAFREARRRREDFLGTEHILHGLLWDRESADLLRSLSLTPDAVQPQVDDVPRQEGRVALERLPPSPAVRRSLQYAAEEAAQLGQTVVGPEHLLLGLLRDEGSLAGVQLGRSGLGLEAARRTVREQPAAEKHDFLLQARAAGPGPHDPTRAEVEACVGPLVPVPAERDAAETTPSIVVPSLAEAGPIERQLRKTQVVLGAILGFYFGERAGAGEHGGWELAVLGAFAGACLALVRSSLAGAWMGFMVGCVFLPSFFTDGDERHAGAIRLLLGAVGALLGSFLGDFWRARSPAIRSNLPRT